MPGLSKDTPSKLKLESWFEQVKVFFLERKQHTFPGLYMTIYPYSCVISLEIS